MLQTSAPPRRRRKLFKPLLVIILVAGLSFIYLRPVAAIHPSAAVKPADEKVASPQLDWPSSGEAAVGAVGAGVLDTSGPQTELPTASTAKLIAALTVLKKYPLKLNETGPTITLGPADVAIYNKYLAEDGSVAKVTDGEQISEYQVLQAMMVPSANNMADSLVTWAFGSMSAYKTAADQTLERLGLNATKIGSDASGFLPNTVSTAHDLVLLGEAALQNPVLAQIVAQPQVTLPVAGTLYNYNSLLGQDGVIGVKTGNSDQAGGVFIFASKYSVDKTHSVTVVGAVQGLPSLQSALNAAIPLLNSAEQNFKVVTVARAGQTVAQYNLPWGAKVDAIAQSNVSALAWGNDRPSARPSLAAVHAPAPAGVAVGSLSASSSIDSSSSKVVLKSKVSSPPWWWRIVRHKP